MDQLSPAQRLFAEREQAFPGTCGHVLGIFFYREERQATYRWLVASDGRTIDSAAFHKSPN